MFRCSYVFFSAKFIPPPFDQTQVRKVADDVRKLRSILINTSNQNFQQNNSTTGSSSVSSLSSPSTLQIRKTLDSLSKHPNEFIEWSRNASVAAVSHVLEGAQLGQVKPNGRFMSQTMIPALWYRFMMTTSNIGNNKNNSNGNNRKQKHQASTDGQPSPFVDLKSLEKESIIIRRLCDIGVFSVIPEGGKENEASILQKKKLDLLKVLCNRVIQCYNSVLSSSSSSSSDFSITIKSINHVVPQLCETWMKLSSLQLSSLDRSPVADDNDRKTGSSAPSHGIVIVKSTIEEILHDLLSTSTRGLKTLHVIENTSDLFHLVRVLRSTISLFVNLHSHNNNNNRLHSRDNTITNNEHLKTISQDFFMTTLRILVHERSNLDRLRGSHLVTLLQACAKAIALQTLPSSDDVADKSKLLLSIESLSLTVIEQWSSMADQHFYKHVLRDDENENTGKSRTSSSSSNSLSSSIFDTTPAAVAKAAFSIETILQHIRKKERREDKMIRKKEEDNSNMSVINSKNSSLLSSDRCLGVLTHDLTLMNVKSFSIAAWCELLSAIRLRNKEVSLRRRSRNNMMNHLHDEHARQKQQEEQSVTSAILSLIESKFIQIFVLALEEQDSSGTASPLRSAQIVLSSILDETGSAKLAPSDVITICDLLEVKLFSANENGNNIKKEENNDDEMMNSSMLSMLLTQQSSQSDIRHIFRDLTRLSVRVTLTHMTENSNDDPQSSSSTNKMNELVDMRTKVIALTSKVYDVILQQQQQQMMINNTNSAPVPPSSGSSSSAVPFITLAIDTTRNLIALGAALNQCESLILESVDSFSDRARIHFCASTNNTKQLVQLIRAVCFCKLVEHGQQDISDDMMQKQKMMTNKKDGVDHQDEKLLQRLLMDRCRLIVEMLEMGLSEQEQGHSIIHHHHHHQLFSTIGECFVRGGIGPCKLLAKAIVSASASLLNANDEDHSKFLIIVKKIASSNEIPIFSSTIDHQVDEDEKSAAPVSSSSSSARAPRNTKQELIFLLTCAEHVLFAPESQHVLMFRDWPQKQKKNKKHDQDDDEEGHHAKLMMSFNSLLLAERNERQFDNVFDWVARYFTPTSKQEQQEEEDVDEDDEAILAQALRVVFDSSLNSVFEEDDGLSLHNKITSQLPFALSSKMLKENTTEGGYVRRAVMTKALANLNEARRDLL